MAAINTLLRAGAIVGATMSVAGLVALVFPPADIPNHFRPYTLAGAAILLLVAATLRQRSILLASTVLVILNAPLVALPLLQSASVTANAQNQQRKVRVIAFNVWRHNQQLNRVANWLASEDADIVVLQEISDPSAAALRPVLAERYPHIYDCGCNELVVASKRPWLEAGGIGRTDSHPSVSWLRFADDHDGTWLFMGLRTAYPMRPLQQARHYRWIEHEVLRTAEPKVLAGDFNLTPWSLQLQYFAWATGLRRHGTWSRSWDARSGLRPRLLLIDNVFASPSINSLGFETGPDLGSDHLPIIATLALP